MILSSKTGSLFVSMTIRKETKVEDHLSALSSKEFLKGFKIDLMEYLSSKYVKATMLIEDKDKHAQQKRDKTREEIIETHFKAVDKILKLCASNATHRVSRIIASMGKEIKESPSIQELITLRTSKTTSKEIELFKTNLPCSSLFLSKRR